MEVDFWGVRAVVVRIHLLLKHSSEKLISYRKRSEMNVKAAENPKFSGYHSSFPSRNF
jgi:hypothetical protein